jgi:hypothetical protein
LLLLYRSPCISFFCSFTLFPLLISLCLGRMAWLGPQLHHRTIDEIVQPIMSEESLSLGDLNFLGASFPDALVVCGDGVFQGLIPSLDRLERFDETVRGVKRIVGTLPAICTVLVVTRQDQGGLTKRHGMCCITAKCYPPVLIVPWHSFPYFQLISRHRCIFRYPLNGTLVRLCPLVPLDMFLESL